MSLVGSDGLRKGTKTKLGVVIGHNIHHSRDETSITIAGKKLVTHGP